MVESRGSAQEAVRCVYQVMGVDLDERKQQPMGTQRMFLGVQINLSQALQSRAMIVDVNHPKEVSEGRPNSLLPWACVSNHSDIFWALPLLICQHHFYLCDWHSEQLTCHCYSANETSGIFYIRFPICFGKASAAEK